MSWTTRTIGMCALAWALGGADGANAQPCLNDLDDGAPENRIGDGGQFVWVNRFTPDSFPFELNEVWAQFGTTNVFVGDDIDIVIHFDTDGDGDPGTGAVHQATYRVQIQATGNGIWNEYRLDPPVLVPGPGDLLIGLVNRSGREGFDDFPAQLDQTATQQRSWAASYNAGDVPDPPTYPSDEQWGLIDSFGFPGNWMIRGLCSGEQACGRKAKLIAKCKKRGEKVVGKLKKADANTDVTFTVDGGDAQEKTTNNRGKATAKWTRLEAGPHTVAVCDLESDC